jgi:cytochrome b involved in lipid metabolism
MMRKILLLPILLVLLTGCTSTPAQQEPKTYTASEVSVHNQESDCWMIVSGKVYDITSYISQHPAGKESILKGCGIDDSANYSKVNPHKGAADILGDYYVGDLAK